MANPAQATGEDFSYVKHLPPSKLPVGGQPPLWLRDKLFQVENDGIYKGLPVYDVSDHGKTAIVCGATGLSGAHMLRAMSRHPNVWSHIYALSRRPLRAKLPSSFLSNVSHHSIDLLTSPETVAENLLSNGITQWHVIELSPTVTEPEDRTSLWAGAEELADVNGRLFENFLEGMKIAGIRPKRILLQTGGKTYSSHLGPVMSPNWEDDTSHARTYKQPNFYYTQEDIMWKYCKDNNIEWACCRPGVILGVVEDNALNIVIPLVLYAAITKFMGTKLLRFPGTRAALEQIHDVGSAVHNGIFMEWQMLAPQAADQIFNLNDGTPFSWLRFWDWLTKYFGLEWEPPLLEDDPTANWTTYSTTDETPPVGYGEPTSCKYSFSLADWSCRQDVREAWSQMAKKYHLKESSIDMKYSWAMANWAMCRWWNVNLGMAKARKYGYFGAVDWTDSLAEIFEEAVAMKIIPPVEALRSYS